MATLRQIAELLAAAGDVERLEPIASLIGCARSAPLDAESRAALGIDESVRAARIATGAGSLRALLLELGDGRAMRDVLLALAGRLSRRAPHVLWIVVAVHPRDDELAIAAWLPDRRPPRVSALVARRAQITDSDAETVRSLAAAAGSRDLLTHARWVEVLGREALSARFYRGLETSVRAIAESSNVGSDAARGEIALLSASRLLFLCFLEAKGWLNADHAFLATQYERCIASGGRFHDRVLRPLFFGTLNTRRAKRTATAVRFGNIPFLNGGLFARTSAERRLPGLAFGDDAYGALIYDLFARYRFTAAEESAGWNEAAVDPEMLGRAFESLMATRERRGTGAFFTPFALVEHVTSFALEDAFAANDRVTLERLTLLDPACGSGAFLVHALERVAARLADLGDRRDASAIRRDVLTRSIFGVDVNPTAVWLCQLRLWLSVVIESDAGDPSAIAPLPNLDRNIRVGDALVGDDDSLTLSGNAAVIRRLRRRYAGATGARKRSLGRELDRAERARAIATIDARLAAIAERRRDLVAVRRGRDLFGDRYHPSHDERDAALQLRRRAAALRAARRRIASGGAVGFSFGVHFADAAARGGFDAIVGNPPWVRIHHIPPDRRAAFKQDFFVARAAAWDAGASQAGAGSGFAAQIDLSALFVERSLGLLSATGTAALLVPAKLWRSLAGGGVRRLLAERASVRRLEDHSEGPAAFDAAVYPSLAVFTCAPRGEKSIVKLSLNYRGHPPLSWPITLSSLPFDESPGAPWILLPPDARCAFDLVRRAGRPLAASQIGRPLLGVKCGCNDAFLVELIDGDDERALVRTSDGRTIEIERALVRPLLRGEQLERWSVPANPSAVIWTHDATGAPFAKLPPLAARWLQRWRRELAGRSDAKRSARWWSLFRTASARNDRPRVVWGDVGREPRASVLEAGDAHVPLNSCYVARCAERDDALALAALLNGPVMRAWLDTIAEPARGGYRRYLGWTVALAPIPHDWLRARSVLAPLAESARAGSPPTASELVDAAVAAYGLDRDDVAPLVAWASP